MMAPSGSPDEAAGQKRHRTLRRSRLFVAERTGIRAGSILYGLVTVRPRVPVLLGGHESERGRLRSLCAGRAGSGAAFLVDDVLASAVCPLAARGTFGCACAALVIKPGAPSWISADRRAADEIPGAAGGVVDPAAIRQRVCVLSEFDGRSGWRIGQRFASCRRRQETGIRLAIAKLDAARDSGHAGGGGFYKRRCSHPDWAISGEAAARRGERVHAQWRRHDEYNFFRPHRRSHVSNYKSAGQGSLPAPVFLR